MGRQHHGCSSGVDGICPFNSELNILKIGEMKRELKEDLGINTNRLYVNTVRLLYGALWPARDGLDQKL